MKYYLIGLFVATVCMFSCEPQTAEPPYVEPEYSNSQIPADNDLILHSVRFGNDQFKSQFYLAEPSVQNGMYVVGSLDASQSSVGTNVGGQDIEDYFDPAVIKLDDSGEKIWEKRPGFTIRSILVIPAGILGSKEHVLLAGYDENEANPDDPDRNRMMLFDSDGTFINSLAIDFQQNMNAMVISANTAGYVEILISGGFFRSSKNNYYPNISKIQISKSDFAFSSLDETELVNETWAGVQFQNVALDNGKIVVSGYETDGGQHSSNYVAAHAAAFSYNNPEDLLWKQKISNSDLEIFLYRRGMHIENNKVYLCGSLRDDQKGETASGQHWTSGFLVALDINSGSMNWNKVYRNAQKGDWLYDVHLWNNKIYLAGVSSTSYCTTCTEEYTIGNAWIQVVNPANGEPISSRTFGATHLQTRINQFIIKNDVFWAFGSESTTRPISKAWLMGLPANSL